MTSLRSLAIPDLVADPARVQRLIAEGETLFVERKARDPKDGLGPTVASFANMLGGWLLIGVTNDGRVVGYEPPGRVDLQDYIRDLLRTQVDPLPPFAAITVPAEGEVIGVVRVAESSDQPHITSDGVLYVRNPGGKHPVTDHRDILQMARRGEEARAAAAERQYSLPLIEAAMRNPDRIHGDVVMAAHFVQDRVGPMVQWIIRATPYTVTGAFADRALSEHVIDAARQTMSLLFSQGSNQTGVDAQARARGVVCLGGGRVGRHNGQVELALDAGGVVALRLAYRPDRGVIDLRELTTQTLVPLIRAVADVLEHLDGFGRAAVGLEARGVLGTDVRWEERHVGQIHGDHVRRHGGLIIGGDLAVPADDEDVRELADGWARELARAARLPIWEPAVKLAATQPEDS